MAAHLPKLSIFGLAPVLASTNLVAPREVTTGSPVYTEQIVTAPDGTAGNDFGGSVALAQDTAVVGAHAPNAGAQGSAYIYVRNGPTWNLQQKLTASDGHASDEFGISVAISGETALVGAWGASVDNKIFQGAAYVFTRTGTVWTEQAKLTAPDGVEYQRFGHSVAISGDTAVVGMPFAEIGGNHNQGAAYVFTRTGTSWNFQQKLTASDGAASKDFSFSLALEGDTILVGATTIAEGGCNQGSAYVFVRNKASWTQQAKLTPSDSALNDCFGGGVALSNNTALVGAEGAAIGPNLNQGAAYVFTRDGTTWAQQAKLTADGGLAEDRFGSSVSLLGNKALVGAFCADIGSIHWQGAAYVFTRSGADWSQQTRLTASNGSGSEQFGTVSLAGATALVGAPNSWLGFTQGYAYFYTAALPFSTYLPVLIR